jgi:hypothetical protein
VAPTLIYTGHRVLIQKNSDRYASIITLLRWSLSSRRSVFTARYEVICNYLLREFRALSRPCHGSALVPRLLTRRPGFDSRSVVGRVAIEQDCFPVLRFSSCQYLVTITHTRRTNGHKSCELSHSSARPEIGKHWIEGRLSLFLCFSGVSQCRLHFKAFINILKPEIYLASFSISCNLQ